MLSTRFIILAFALVLFTSSQSTHGVIVTRDVALDAASSPLSIIDRRMMENVKRTEKKKKGPTTPSDPSVTKNNGTDPLPPTSTPDAIPSPPIEVSPTVTPDVTPTDIGGDNSTLPGDNPGLGKGDSGVQLGGKDPSSPPPQKSASSMIKCITNELAEYTHKVGDSPELEDVWKSWKTLVRKYLDDYHEKHPDSKDGGLGGTVLGEVGGNPTMTEPSPLKGKGEEKGKGKGKGEGKGKGKGKDKEVANPTPDVKNPEVIPGAGI